MSYAPINFSEKFARFGERWSRDHTHFLELR